jgi:hypothetical protein
MNPGGLPVEIKIESAHNYARMVRLQVVEANKMLSIERQYSPGLTMSELENCGVTGAAIVKTGFVRSQDIVAQLTKRQHHW